jgi:dipeptidyl aminopeptidase/acylaminoacyl peptidase
MKSRLLAFILISAAAPLLAANFTLEQVMSSPFPSNLVAAAHSGRIAWVFSTKGVRNVWVADAPKFEARQLTHYDEDDGQAIPALSITPDGRTLAYARGTEVNEEGRVADPTSDVTQRKEQVFAIDIEGGNPRHLGEMDCGVEGCERIELSPDGQFAVWHTRKQLWITPVSGATPSHQLTDLRGNNGDPRWSPDGRSIAFVSDRGDHSFVAIYDFGRDKVRYLAPTADRDTLPRWSPDGKQIAFVRREGIAQKVPLLPLEITPWSIWVADPSTLNARQVWHSGSQANDSFPDMTEATPFYFAANDKVVFSSEQDGRNHLYSIAAAGGSPTPLTPGEFDVEDTVLTSDSASVIYSSNQNDVDRRHIWKVAIGGGKPQPLTKGDTIEWTPVEVGSQVICLGSTATSPAMPYLITASGKQMLAPAALPSDFPSQELVIPKQVTFKTDDGFEIHGQLFVPAGLTTAGPALIFTHGGPARQMMLGFHYMYYYHNAYAMNQYLTSLGYVVLSVNYRLGIMYGRAFRVPEDASWRGGAEYKDVQAGAKYLQGLPVVNPKKIGLWGGSYGGYLTAMGLAHNSDTFAAGVDMHGVHDWSLFLPHGEPVTGAPDLEEAKKVAFNASPNSAVSTWKSPVLLIHGDDDRNVPFNQTVDLVQRLRKNQVPFEELIFPDEIHDFLLWRSWVRA